MKKIRLIKTQTLLAVVSVMMCLVTILCFAFSSPKWTVTAAENEGSESEVNPPGESKEETPPGGVDITPAPTGEPEEPVCICTSKCSKDKINEKCPVCSVDYSKCTWIDPKVAIAIDNPSDWKTKATKIGITVVDENKSGHFFIDKVEARIGSTGSYVDITDDMYVTISENCTLYIQVTEENGNVTNKNRKFSCFDTDKPSVNAGIEGELLYVEADDATSGVYAIYVNGHKFTDLNEGKLTVNIKDYDSVYEYVTIHAYDHAGNRSGSYKIKNPYYVNPEKRENKEDQSVNNPASIKPSAPTSATATVVEHTGMDGKTDTINAPSNEDEDSDDNNESSYSDSGKEFYTIATATDKVFYLVIDKDRSQENVHLLTEVNENDLLNFVNYSGEPVTQGDLPLYTVDPEVVDANKPEAEEDDVINVPEEPEVEEPKKEVTANNNSLLLIAVIAVIAGVGLYFFKKKGKKSDYEYELDADDIDEFEPVEDADNGDEIYFEEEDAIPADIVESVMEEVDE